MSLKTVLGSKKSMVIKVTGYNFTPSTPLHRHGDFFYEYC